LPDVVHGSALFSRGETQVLCTATLGAPQDGLPLSNPYQETEDPKVIDETKKGSGPYAHLPVGSLRYLRSQEALVSDLNSRRVKADREMTGDSGTLDEVSLQLGDVFLPPLRIKLISADAFLGLGPSILHSL
jgi:hypothetical protein